METLDHHGSVASVTADLQPVAPRSTTWTGTYTVWTSAGPTFTRSLGHGTRDELTARVYDIASKAGAL